jgi:hypothetical protein
MPSPKIRGVLQESIGLDPPYLVCSEAAANVKKAEESHTALRKSSVGILHRNEAMPY